MKPPKDGQCVSCGDKRFDDHFCVNTDMVRQALRGVGPDGSPAAQFADFPQIQKQPEAWGLKVRFIWKLWEYIADDVKGYASAHCLDESLSHVCLVNPCRWHHAGVRPVQRSKARGRLKQMRANMHLVVERYVKPWTEDLNAGLALMLNAGHMAWSVYSRPSCAAELCKASVYISHSWAEDFEDFARTLRQALDPETVVWVCSFALYQHGDIAGALSDLEKCPFAVAMRESPRVLLVTDRTTEAVTRCWVVLEALFASKWKKLYDMSLPDDGDADLWRAVGCKLEGLDVAYCHASRTKDKEAILSYAQNSPGGIPALNDSVRAVARNAMKRAELMAAATSGDIERLKAADSCLLEGWMSIRGRTATHVAAAHSHVAAVVEILSRTGNAHLNRPDSDGCTPLSVAVQGGALASVLALVSLQADLDSTSSDGLTPLHYAASGRQPAVAEALLEAGANIEAQGTYQGRLGHRPLTVAALEGRTELVRTLVAWRADLKAATAAGTCALHVAAWEGRTDAAAALITCKAEVDAPTQDSYGRTALMLAFKNGQAAVVSLLLGARANPLRGSRQGSCCHTYAISAISSSSGGGKKAHQGQLRRRRRFDTIMEAGLLVSGHCDNSDIEIAQLQSYSGRRFSFMPPRRSNSTGLVKDLPRLYASGARSRTPRCIRRKTPTSTGHGKTASCSPTPSLRKTSCSTGSAKKASCSASPSLRRSPKTPTASGPTGNGGAFDMQMPLIERIAQRRRGTFINRAGEDAAAPPLRRKKQPETPKKRPAPEPEASELLRSPLPPAPGSARSHAAACGPGAGAGAEGLPESPRKRPARTPQREEPKLPESPRKRPARTPQREEPRTPKKPTTPGVPKSWRAARSPSLEDLLALLPPSPPR